MRIYLLFNSIWRLFLNFLKSLYISCIFDLWGLNYHVPSIPVIEISTRLLRKFLLKNSIFLVRRMDDGRFEIDQKFIFVNHFYFKEVVMGSEQTLKNALNWDFNPHSLKILIQKLVFLGEKRRLKKFRNLNHFGKNSRKW